jgi:hypothetical protein
MPVRTIWLPAARISLKETIIGLKALPSKERERILRQNWWGHDGRWFFQVASELGFSKASQMNIAINISIVFERDGKKKK